MKTFSVRQKPSIRWLRVAAGTMLAGSVALTLGLAGCGGSGGGGGGGAGAAGSGKITSGISDPAQECAAPNGPYSAVWVTVSDVQANINGSGPNQDLTPSLSNAPVQVNLLSDAVNKDCFLATLGATSGLPAGNYQQIRIFMVPNGTTLNSGAPNPNACAAAGSTVWNCVITSSGTYALDMPSNANTGLKIPPGQIGNGGGLSIANGQGLDLDIDVNACQSVVQRGKSGKFSFKPTLRADELGTNPLIAGNLYEASVSNSTVTIPSVSPLPVPNAKVWLEHQSASVAVGAPAATATSDTVDLLDQTTLSDSNGHFEFCPVGPGAYEIAASVATMPGSAAPSLATITTGINVASSGGPNNLVIPLVPGEVGNSTGNSTAGIVSGTFETQSSANPSTGDDIQFAATQAFNGGAVWALVPEFDGNNTTNPGGTEPPSVPIGASSCSGGNCSYNYSIEVPPGNPVIGAASTSGAGYAAPSPAPTPGVYSVWASATNPNSSNPGNADCTPSELITDALTLSTGTPPVSNGGSLTFQGCSF